MRSDEDGAAAVERLLDDAFRAPEFDDARAERILTRARTAQTVSRRRRGGDWGVRLGVGLAACAALLVAVVAWPSTSGEPTPDASTVARGELSHGSAQSLSGGGWEASRGAARERHKDSSYRLLKGDSWSVAQLRPDYAPLRYGIDPRDAVVMSLDHDLGFSAELVPAPVASGESLVVRLNLTNVSSQTVRWNAFRFGLSTATTFQSVPTVPDGIFLGSLGLAGALRGGSPLVLRSGESTTAILSTAASAGTWRVVAWYEGDPGELSGQTPTMTVLVPSRR